MALLYPSCFAAGGAWSPRRISPRSVRRVNGESARSTANPPATSTGDSKSVAAGLMVVVELAEDDGSVANGAHGVDAHHLERVDLLGDAHRAELGDDARADLRGEHVAERVGGDLAQVAPRGEHAGIRRSAGGRREVRALDPALQAED